MILRILSFTILLILTTISVFGQEQTNRTVFVSKSNFDDLSPINQTTGSAIRQYYYPGFYWSKSEVEKHYIWEEGKYMETYGTSQSQWTTLDYDNDGYLDLFGFMTKSSDLPIGSDYPGKLFVRNDFINNPIEDFNDITFLDQTDIYEYGHSLMADVDGDGKLEIFSHDNDHHIRPDGSSIFRGGISMHKIINDTTVEEYKIGRTTLSHDFALGDIDNDGDIDLIYFLLEYSPNAYDLEIPRGIPQIMMNDGSGNFFEVDTFEYFINLDEVQTHTISGDPKTYKKNWTVIAFDLIDLNDDGILDIVDTYTHNHCVEPTSSAELCENGTVVYWGQGNGYFDLKDKTILPIDYVFDIGGKISHGGGHDHNGNIELFPLGHSFLDINNDGHLDIINAIVMSDPLIDFGGYVSWTIQIIQNNGNGNFVDVTSTHVVGAPKIQDIGQTCEHYGIESLSHVVPYDIDNDGDFDLLPEIVQPPHCTFDDLVLFENRNGVFHFSSRSYPDKVYLSSPSNGSKAETVNPTLSWSGDTNADTYTLQVTTDGFESFVVNESVSDTSFTTPELEYNTEFSWRVRGTNSSGDGDWSEVWKFTTQYRQLSSSTPLNPQDGQDNVGTLTDFRWSEVDSVESYQLQVTTDSTFTTQMFQSEEIDTTTFTLTDPIRENTQYYWRVRSLGEVEQQHSEWSEVMSFTTGVRTSVEGENTIPTSYSLNQNFPNPFNPTTSITYSLPQSAVVSLKIYDITGKYITTLVDGVTSAGVHTATFYAGSLSSGMYVYTLETDGYRQTRQMMLVK